MRRALSARRSRQDERGPRSDRLREEVHEGLRDPDTSAIGGIREADGGRTGHPVVGDRHPRQGDRHRKADASPSQHPSDGEEGATFPHHRHGLADGQEAQSDQEHASTPTQVTDHATDEEPGRLGDDGQQVDRLDLGARAQRGLDGRRRGAEDMRIESGRQRGDDRGEQDAELLPVAGDVPGSPVACGRRRAM